MNALIIVGVIIALSVAAGLGVWLVTSLFDRWVLYRNPDYHRELPIADLKYIKNAQLELERFAQQGEYKKSSNWLIYILFVPIMFLVWGVGLFGWKWLTSWRISQTERSDDLGSILFPDPSLMGVSLIILFFASFLIAGWLAYALSSFDKKFTSWLVLTQSSTQKGESEDSILARRKVHIEHDVRTRQLDIHQPFCTIDFLGSIAGRHGQYCLLLSLPLLIPALFFMYFDMRSQTNFYKEGLSYTKYWSGEKVEVRYQALDHAELKCTFGSKNTLKDGVYFVLNGESIANYEVTEKHLSELAQVDQRLRQSNVSFRPHYFHPPKQAPKLAYRPNCLEKRKEQFSGEQQDQIIQVLHIGEISP